MNKKYPDKCRRGLSLTSHLRLTNPALVDLLRLKPTPRRHCSWDHWEIFVKIEVIVNSLKKLTFFFSRCKGFVTGRSFAATVVSRYCKDVVSVRCKFFYIVPISAASSDIDKRRITRNFSSTSCTQATLTPVVNLQMQIRYCKQIFLASILRCNSIDVFIWLERCQCIRAKRSIRKSFQSRNRNFIKADFQASLNYKKITGTTPLNPIAAD